jgi:hypothetical protein
MCLPSTGAWLWTHRNRVAINQDTGNRGPLAREQQWQSQGSHPVLCEGSGPSRSWGRRLSQVVWWSLFFCQEGTGDATRPSAPSSAPPEGRKRGYQCEEARQAGRRHLRGRTAPPCAKHCQAACSAVGRAVSWPDAGASPPGTPAPGQPTLSVTDAPSVLAEVERERVIAPFSSSPDSVAWYPLKASCT